MTKPTKETDGFGPPNPPREVKCLHCGSKYMSDKMLYEERDGMELWWCAVLSCDGAGYGFDIFDADDPMVRR